jgi:hypothetical protein
MNDAPGAVSHFSFLMLLFLFPFYLSATFLLSLVCWPGTLRHYRDEPPPFRQRPWPPHQPLEETLLRKRKQNFRKVLHTLRLLYTQTIIDSFPEKNDKMGQGLILPGKMIHKMLWQEEETVSLQSNLPVC